MKKRKIKGYSKKKIKFISGFYLMFDDNELYSEK